MTYTLKSLAVCGALIVAANGSSALAQNASTAAPGDPYAATTPADTDDDDGDEGKWGLVGLLGLAGLLGLKRRDRDDDARRPTGSTNRP